MKFADKMREVAEHVAAFKKDFTKGTVNESVHEKGYRILRGADPVGVMSLANLIADVKEGKKHPFYLQEAMTTDDFPLLFGDLLNKVLMGNYRAWPTTYQQWCTTVTVKDFKTLKLYTQTGGDTKLTTVVHEREEYPEVAFAESRETVSVEKYGRRFGLSWEMLVNDDLGAFQGLAARLGTGASRGIEYFATDLIAGSTGFDTGVFTVGNENIITSNPVFSITALQTAMKLFRKKLDSNGEPIQMDAVQLLYGPALDIEVKNLLNSSMLRLSDAPGTSGQLVYTQNWMQGKLIPIELPYLPIIASSSNTDTTWFLNAAPSVGNRPGALIAKLRGLEEPQTFQEDTNQRLLGGGEAPFELGSFQNDTNNYKIKWAFGGKVIDPKLLMASNGSGS